MLLCPSPQRVPPRLGVSCVCSSPGRESSHANRSILAASTHHRRRCTVETRRIDPRHSCRDRPRRRQPGRLTRRSAAADFPAIGGEIDPGARASGERRGGSVRLHAGRAGARLQLARWHAAPCGDGPEHARQGGARAGQPRVRGPLAPRGGKRPCLGALGRRALPTPQQLLRQACRIPRRGSPPRARHEGLRRPRSSGAEARHGDARRGVRRSPFGGQPRHRRLLDPDLQNPSGEPGDGIRPDRHRREPLRRQASSV